MIIYKPSYTSSSDVRNGYNDPGAYMDRDSTPFNPETDDDRSRFYTNTIGRVSSVVAQHPPIAYGDLDYEDSQGLECKRGLSRIPDYEGYNIPTSFSPDGTSFMATTTMVYQFESQGRQRALGWGSHAPNASLKWEERDDNISPKTTRSNKEQTTPNKLIPDSTLANLSVKELNKRVQNYQKEDIMALKQRRRTLKNRGYAVQCRMRRQQHKETLEHQVAVLSEQLHEMNEELTTYKRFFHEKCRCRQAPPLEMLNNNAGVSHPQAPLIQEYDYKRQDQKLGNITIDEFRRFQDGGIHPYHRQEKLQDGMFRPEFADSESKAMSAECHNKM